MRKGASSFAGYASLVVPSTVLFMLLTGSVTGSGALIGLFFTLVFCNSLDRRG